MILPQSHEDERGKEGGARRVRGAQEMAQIWRLTGQSFGVIVRYGRSWAGQSPPSHLGGFQASLKPPYGVNLPRISLQPYWLFLVDNKMRAATKRLNNSLTQITK